MEGIWPNREESISRSPRKDSERKSEERFFPARQNESRYRLVEGRVRRDRNRFWYEKRHRPFGRCLFDSFGFWPMILDDGYQFLRICPHGISIAGPVRSGDIEYRLLMPIRTGFYEEFTASELPIDDTFWNVVDCLHDRLLSVWG